MRQLALAIQAEFTIDVNLKVLALQNHAVGVVRIRRVGVAAQATVAGLYLVGVEADFFAGDTVLDQDLLQPELVFSCASITVSSPGRRKHGQRKNA